MRRSCATVRPAGGSRVAARPSRVSRSRAPRSCVPTPPRPAPISMARPMRRSTSAPTIAGCWWRARPMTGSASSMPFRGSSGWARGSRRPAGWASPRSRAPIEVLRICRDKMRNRGVTRARLIATEACRLARERRRLSGSGAARGRHRARNRRSRDRSAAGRDRLHAADRSAGARARSCSISAAAPRRSPISAARRPCRRGPPEPEMHGWVSLPVGVVTLAERHGGIDGDARDFRGDGRGGERSYRAVSRANTRPAGCLRHASARHVGHGDDHRRRASRSAGAMTAGASTAAGCWTMK